MKNKLQAERKQALGSAWEASYRSTQRYIGVLQQRYLGGVWEI